MTRQIELTQGKFALVDDEDFEYLNQWKWQAYKKRNAFYAAYQKGGRLHRETIYMHRLIMNTPNGVEVDHIDNNGLNNTRANMRNCTHIENRRNNKKYSNNSSGYKGVDWNKGKWRAQINVNGKFMFLGYFSNSEEAADAYDQAAQKYFGEYANLNSQ